MASTGTPASSVVMLRLAIYMATVPPPPASTLPNAAYLNYGIGLCKYTGARGKSGASDASAETVGYVRGIFDRAKVIWQIAELGKVDAGGGGTVAMYMANRNITTLDAGVPVLASLAPDLPRAPVYLHRPMP